MNQNAEHTTPDPELVEAIKVALREVLPPIVQEAVRQQMPRMALGEDLPLDLDAVVEVLPISEKTLHRIRKKRAFRMLRMPHTGKPVTTVGALRAFIKKWQLED